MPPQITELSSDDESHHENEHMSRLTHRQHDQHKENVFKPLDMAGLATRPLTRCSLSNGETDIGNLISKSSANHVPKSIIEVSDSTSGIQSDRDVAEDDADEDSDVYTLKDDDQVCSGFETAQLPTPPLESSRNLQVRIPKSTLIHPKSAFWGFVPPAKEMNERQALNLLMPQLLKNQANVDYLEIVLDDFCVYTATSRRYPSELTSLHKLAAAGPTGISVFHFDGIITIGSQRIFLRRVPFRNLPVEGYDDTTETVAGQIWVQSLTHKKQYRQIFYRLQRPAREYSRFFVPFLWIADLAKHVIDFCAYYHSDDRHVTLSDFKSAFSAYITTEYRHSAIVQDWHSANRSTDFRTAVVANVEYIYKEAASVAGYDLSWHPIWSEIRAFDRYQPNFPTTPISLVHVPKTVVTPYIRDLFGHMVFGSVFETVSLSPNVQAARMEQIKSLTTSQTSPPPIRRSQVNQDDLVNSIREGDVISTHTDDANTQTSWKLESSIHHEEHHVWIGLVQKVHIREKTRYFDVLWLYHPRDTSCSKMKYPWKNELFLSDNCTCHSSCSRIRGDEVIATHNVQWFGDERTRSEFFVRQIYLPHQNRWEQLEERHLRCTGFDEDQLNFVVGDTGLARINKRKRCRLHPVVIEDIFPKDEQMMARVRILGRRPNAPANELLWTEDFVMLKVKNFQRRCFVRVFTENDEIPTPYDRGGTGDFFYLRQTEGANLTHLRQAFDPRQPSTPKLRGLDLFCGGGNFGRGLEEGFAVEMCWANDISPKAMHTYMANANATCEPLLGSVDDLLRTVMEGSTSCKIPKPGDVDFISGGSPCPGFSLLTVDKNSPAQRKNQSLVASFASFIDVLRPKFGVLENVKQMVEKEKNKDNCVLSQLVCALVGLGYQTQLMWLDAWSYGAAQSRERIFLCFAAPGQKLPRMPEPSHSHPPKVKMGSIGMMSSGLPYHRRQRAPTPLDFISADVATADLPDIQDAKPDYCVGFPDHRLAVGFTALLRRTSSVIPLRPYGLNFNKVAYGNGGSWDLDKKDRRLFGRQGSHRTGQVSKSLGRVHPRGLFGTLTTACQPMCSRAGTVNHWSQNRPMTVLEARRAQGYPDDDVILGTPKDQWKVVGNSVSRHVSLVLGLAFREAWIGTLLDENLDLPIR